VVYRKGSVTLGVVMRCESVIRTLCFGSCSSSDAKFGCSIKIDHFMTKSQLKCGVSEISVKYLNCNLSLTNI
jgi:hypothetical protein